MDAIKSNLVPTLHIKYPSGHKVWHFNGKIHRVDGPAIEYPNGDKEWRLDGAQYSIEEWEVARKMLWIL